jgi:B-block binding subunit of TFIIIC
MTDSHLQVSNIGDNSEAHYTLGVIALLHKPSGEHMLETIQKLIPWVGTLSTVPKLLLSLVVVALAGFTLAIVWVPQAVPVDPTKKPTGAGPMWPNEKSLDALKRKLDRISETNAKIIKIVGKAGQYGIYVNDLATKTKQTRDEVVYRLKDLEKESLVEVLSLTDMNARLNEDVLKVLGANAGDFLASYLK